ncbi:MAG: hypothetical protein TQ37_00865 [Candidatus Synechococcus spongiarum 15L]|uniref:Uncharacterized protein n=1 Tax=Candidatus Synechococcus spongiarum 15L TaxID=1608419 RepID=A0A0G8AZX7_9SYNE|nr:MAG: hypothetical protein TQ37_00865 [Candidatus Synechococcus spongiarum 15L]
MLSRATKFGVNVKDVEEPLFFQQWCGVTPKAGGRLLEGVEYNFMPSTPQVGVESSRGVLSRDRSIRALDLAATANSMKMAKSASATLFPVHSASAQALASQTAKTLG